jgi:hypothetical protein
MKKSNCCPNTVSAAGNVTGQAAGGKGHPSPAAQRRSALAKCSLPTLILALLPKCPACFAAYVAMGTGVSLSMATASVLRTLLMAVCVAVLAWAFARIFRTLPVNRLLSGNRVY